MKLRILRSTIIGDKKFMSVLDLDLTWGVSGGSGQSIMRIDSPLWKSVVRVLNEDSINIDWSAVVDLDNGISEGISSVEHAPLNSFTSMCENNHTIEAQIEHLAKECIICGGELKEMELG